MMNRNQLVNHQNTKHRDFSHSKAWLLFLEGAYKSYVTEKNKIHNVAMRKRSKLSDVIEIEAGADFEIGTKQSFINSGQGIIKNHAKQLFAEHEQGMQYFGAINQNSAPANLKATKTKAINQTFAHQEIEDISRSENVSEASKPSAKFIQRQAVENNSFGKSIAKAGLSFALDLTPGVGQLKAAREIYSGIDPVTGFKVNRGLSILSLIPGAKLAAKTFGWLKGTKMVIAGMKLASQSKVLTTAGKGLKVSYNFISSSKAVVGKHVANGAIGGVSSYTGSVVTGDKHPYRSAAIGTGVGLAFGTLPFKNINRATLYTGGASMVTEVISQRLDKNNNEINSYNFPKLVYKTYVRSLVGGLTYGMPLVAGAIVGWGPSTVFGKLGDELLR